MNSKTEPAKPYTPPKIYKRQGQHLYTLFQGKVNAPATPSHTIVDENSDGYFVIYYQMNGASKAYPTAVSFIGKELVEQ